MLIGNQHEDEIITHLPLPLIKNIRYSLFKMRGFSGPRQRFSRRKWRVQFTRGPSVLDLISSCNMAHFPNHDRCEWHAESFLHIISTVVWPKSALTGENMMFCPSIQLRNKIDASRRCKESLFAHQFWIKSTVILGEQGTVSGVTVFQSPGLMWRNWPMSSKRKTSQRCSGA